MAPGDFSGSYFLGARAATAKGQIKNGQSRETGNTGENIFFFCREFFFQNLTLMLYVKTLNQIIFFSSTKIRIFFQQHWESEYFFRKKNHNPPPSS
jgi:hypothetical protein